MTETPPMPLPDDERLEGFLEGFRSLIERVNTLPPRMQVGLTPLGRAVQEHLGTAVDRLPLVTEDVPSHRFVDLDIALEAMAGPDGRLVGVTGGQQREHEPLPALLTSPYAFFDLGPVDFAPAPTGPSTERQTVAFGMRLFEFDGAPVAVLQRASRREFGRESARIEVLSADRDHSGRLLSELRRLMLEFSVLRGKVLTFTGGDFDPHVGGAAFLERPDVSADDVVLPDGVLETISRHVVGIGTHRERLRAAGRHLKRGVLLYGPPGTGKTLTVRHLLATTPGTTAVLLTGPSIHFVSEATELARAMQPALVVLEDIDLIAHERGRFGPQPLLFAVLDALDGLTGDADVTFVMTTNRVELLERALAERPGRVDLAVEIPLPDAVARARLFRLYAEGLPLGEATIEAAAHRSTGVTASFAKELMRRVVLRAAEAGREVRDADLPAALDELLSAREALTRSLLGAGDLPAGPPPEDAGFGWTSY
ncbi:AAA family ATPase [Lysobacter korlensis]|uniref:AAA family ATPase n=1 Tax=Lysobacter korlensis TaxID=553636 RepID=A0ABV6RXG8_9GAMM